jgi:hypothetical protein
MRKILKPFLFIVVLYMLRARLSETNDILIIKSDIKSRTKRNETIRQCLRLRQGQNFLYKYYNYITSEIIS